MLTKLSIDCVQQLHVIEVRLLIINIYIFYKIPIKNSFCFWFKRRLISNDIKLNWSHNLTSNISIRAVQTSSPINLSLSSYLKYNFIIWNRLHALSTIATYAIATQTRTHSAAQRLRPKTSYTKWMKDEKKIVWKQNHIFYNNNHILTYHNITSICEKRLKLLFHLAFYMS